MYLSNSYLVNEEVIVNLANIVKIELDKATIKLKGVDASDIVLTFASEPAAQAEFNIVQGYLTDEP